MGHARLKRKKVCVVTGSRADYGILKTVMESIRNERSLELYLVVTGSHLDRRWGRTISEIEDDGFDIFSKLGILPCENDEMGVTKAFAACCSSFADVFHRLSPDIVLLLGDRYEVLAAATSAHIAKIPIAHVHGGETTEGAIDEAFRHAITKMAQLHFTTNERYRRRVIQLGESPDRVFVSGAPALDALNKTAFLCREDLSCILGFDLSGIAALVTYHPVTLERTNPERQIGELLGALRKFPMKVVFTKANADPLGNKINRMLVDYCERNPLKAKLVAHLGQLRYMSCLKTFDVVIGNTSSGIIEAPSFGIPVVNVGSRQRGRIRAANIIDVSCSREFISEGIRKALSLKFRAKARRVKNPYDPYRDGRAGERIAHVMKKALHEGVVLEKKFYDVSYALKGRRK